MYQFIANIESDKTFFFYRGGVALYALLWAMDIEPGDEVILQVFTCPAVPSPIVRLGATPIYVDIDPKTFNLDPGKIEAKITPRTKAIIVQHTFGIPAKMTEILAIAQKYNLCIIEDCCHALGSRYDGCEVGTLGDAAIYSFGWYKPIVLGVGGAAIVHNPALHHKMTELYQEFVTPSKKQLIGLYVQNFAYDLLLSPSLFWMMRGLYRTLSKYGVISGTWRRKKTSSNWSGKTETVSAKRFHGSRIIPFQEKRLFRKLSHFDRLVAHQKRIVAAYEKLLAQTEFNPLELDGNVEPIYYKYPILAERKQEIFEKAPKAHVELSDMFVSPVYPSWRKAKWKALGYCQGMCPISEEISDKIVALPVHARVKVKNIKKTITFLESFSSVR